MALRNKESDHQQAGRKNKEALGGWMSFSLKHLKCFSPSLRERLGGSMNSNENLKSRWADILPPAVEVDQLPSVVWIIHCHTVAQTTQFWEGSHCIPEHTKVFSSATQTWVPALSPLGSLSLCIFLCALPLSINLVECWDFTFPAFLFFKSSEEKTPFLQP